MYCKQAQKRASGASRTHFEISKISWGCAPRPPHSTYMWAPSILSAALQWNLPTYDILWTKIIVRCPFIQRENNIYKIGTQSSVLFNEVSLFQGILKRGSTVYNISLLFHSVRKCNVYLSNNFIFNMPTAFYLVVQTFYCLLQLATQQLLGG